MRDDEWQGVVHKVDIAGQIEGYVCLDFDEEGNIVLLRMTFSKEGSTVSGLMEVMARLINVALKNGVPARKIADQLVGLRFEPNGFSGGMGSVESVADYLGKLLYKKGGSK